MEPLDMETAALVAPVTALEFLQDAFLLTGEGPVLTVYSLQPRPIACSSLSVLQHHRIHGIRPRVSSSDTTGPSTTSFYDLAVFGGKAVRLVRLHGDSLRLEVLGELMALQDWALDVRWLPGETRPLLCVAVAHNAALLLDAGREGVVTQRSCVEGCLLYSALLVAHESWEDAVLVGGTVFNQLILWRPGAGGEDNNRDAPVERRLLGHSGVIFSISYLEEKGWLASASDDRSVRVWAVGTLGGPGGRCGDENPACLRVLFGHQARVFSVHLAPGKVFSAGEDGACLVWDWAGGGTVSRTLKGHRAGGVRALAVSEATGAGGSRGRWVATGGADGGVRLWRVDGSEERKEKLEDAGTEKLTDLKFSGHGTPKVVCVVEEEEEEEAGSWSRCSFVICTDAGIVYRFFHGQWETVWSGTPEFQSYCVMETVAVGVGNSRVNLCAVGNLSGAVQVFSISHPRVAIRLTAGSGKIHSLTWQERGEDVYLFASGADGLVHRWCVDVRGSENSPWGLRGRSLPPFLLPTCAKRWLTAAVGLRPDSLWVCGDRRGSLLLFQEGEDVRRPALTETEGGRGSSVLQPLSCLFGVHGKQGVTSVREYRGLLYSTGRDGCVRVFTVGRTADGVQLEVLRVQRACRGMEWLERVLILTPDAPDEGNFHQRGSERQLFTDTLGSTAEGRGGEARFVIVGFHGVHLVVWDPVKQHRVLAVPCGGGHRSWSLWPLLRGVWAGRAALVFIKQGAVLASQPPGVEPGWAGRAGGWGLREGVHGRGIGCVCHLGTIRGLRSEPAAADDGVKEDVGLWDVVVTGGEDTSLTVMAIQRNGGGVKVLSVITDHISGVRTMAAVTHPPGGEGGNRPQRLSALLVSASGRAQMQCYRLSVCWDELGRGPAPSCQVIQVAGHRLDEHWERRRNRHKMVKMDPETRYMSIAVVDVRTEAVLLALACSDGAVRLFSISEVKRQIDLLWETFHHKRCVLSVATCSLEDGQGNRFSLLFSAATDGSISVWDLTDTLSSSSSSSSSALSPPIHCIDIPAHQSGVNSLAVWAEKQWHQDGGCLATVASGGDDGQLTVSTIKLQRLEGCSRGLSQSAPQSRLHLHVRSQARVSLAHAAPLTALKLLSRGCIVTTSPDQRVCLWSVGSTGISHRGALCSHVADAAGLAVWEGQEMEEEGGKKERAEQEMAISGGTGRRTGIGGVDVTDGGETGGEPTARVSETGDPVCKSRDQAEEKGGGKGRGSTGWVLVCGHGLQLLRVRERREDEEKVTEGQS